jgi:ParB-like chromosome segregation protein Spo0J
VSTFPQLTNWPADEVERRPIAELLPYAGNTRLHSPEQIEQIAASIKQWGWTNPVLVDERGEIIAGHARVLAAKSLGLEDAPVMLARGWSDDRRAILPGNTRSAPARRGTG